MHRTVLYLTYTNIQQFWLNEKTPLGFLLFVSPVNGDDIFTSLIFNFVDEQQEDNSLASVWQVRLSESPGESNGIQ